MEEPAALRPKRAQMWHDWFRVRFAANTPYDELARGVLCATSRNEQPIERWIASATALERQAAAGFATDYARQPALDLFWRRMADGEPVPVEDLAELTASAFLGLRLHCARCHRHPFDRWTQRDFAAYATIFARTGFGSSTEARTAMQSLLEARRQARRDGREVSAGEIPPVREVFVSEYARRLVDAAVPGATLPAPPGGPPLEESQAPGASGADADPRQQLFAWLVQPDNPYFARSFVNRVWARYFGRGLVDPVDAFADSNPASYPRLLKRLGDAFVASGYDIARLERLILSSAAYGRSSRAAGNNAADRNQFARAAVRPLPPEVLVDAVDAVLETRSDFGPNVPPGTPAVGLAANQFGSGNAGEVLTLLGRGDRQSLCDCDRATGPTLRQPLYLAMRAGVAAGEGRLARLLAEGHAPGAIVEEFYLAALGRPPDEEERAVALGHLAQAADARAALEDVVWALVNTREFCTNH
jgi:hypothetical protein